MPRQASSNTASTAQLGFEQKLWRAADKRRNNIDAAEEEQTRIIERLAENDALRLGLQNHLAKLRLQKQGLMQNLLSARVSVKTDKPD